ncbi:MAG: acetate--CoA ligase family protein [Armatimonadetes bacterium]|nr:acetate--CoA ligase family protein [Armatimonadota bacterium]
MKLFEFESKSILRSFGIAVTKGRVVRTTEELDTAYAELGPKVVLKAQVTTGGRMKAGGVIFASTLEEATAAYDKLAAAKIKGYEVAAVLIEKETPFEREYYAGITYDQGAKLPVVVFSSTGGIDVEESSKSSVNSMRWDLRRPLDSYRCRELLLPFDMPAAEFLAISTILKRLSEIFYSLDATLVEVNPLVSGSAGITALDAHIELDDDALYRHSDLSDRYGIDMSLPRSKSQSKFEESAAKIDQQDHRGVAGRVVEFDGDLGLLIGGGGASLTIFDAIKRHGGSPANYCEIGGNPSVAKIADLTKLILSAPRVNKIAVIMNVVSNTRSDLVARGVIKGVIESGFNPSEKISIFRIPGAWEAEGCKLLEKYGVPHRGRETTLDEAARIAVRGF